MGFKAGFIGIIGQPNAGKSSLMNFIVNEKVSIVTNKPQTTRRRVLGLWNHDEGQIVFVDAPGIIKADKGLNGFLAKEADDVIDNSDALMAVLSVDEGNADHLKEIIEKVKSSHKPWMAVVTKTDLAEFQHRVMIVKDMVESQGGKFATFSIKNNKQEDANALALELLTMLPESPAPLFDLELYTTENVRDMVSEIVREKCFENLFDEVPYNLAVQILKYDEAHQPCLKIAMEIMVAKENHKAIVIGKKGETIKKIGTSARLDIEKLLGEKVFLDLVVAHREDWFKNQRSMKELGYAMEVKKGAQ